MDQVTQARLKSSPPSEAPDLTQRFWPGRVSRHALAVAWLLAVGLAYLAPALSRGGSLGDYELLSAFGFGSVPGTPLHNVVSSDQIQEMIPWTDLSWLQVHSGHLPFWNPFAGLGLPLAFNFQAASFSLTTAVSYLFPLHLAYTVTVVAKLLVGGTGVLFLGRVLNLRFLAATLAGTVFELSGAFTAWSGWPHDGVFCWFGWILGAVVMVARGRNEAGSTALMAVFVGLAVLGGHPESIIISLVCAGVFALGYLTVGALRGMRSGVVARRGALLLAGVAAGLGLSAPVLLPGLQVIAGSSHTGSTGYSALPHSNAVNLIASTFYGLPVLHDTYFGTRNYYEAASYVGIGVLCLAALAVLSAWRRTEVIALASVGLLCAALVYSATVASAVGALPGIDLILWDRAVIPLDLVLAVLAGVGLDTLILRSQESTVRGAYTILALAAGALVAALMIVTEFRHMYGPAALRRERLHSLVAPGVQAGIGLVAAALLFRRRRLARHASATGRNRALAAALLIVAAEVGFLITATPNLWSSSPKGFVTTVAERTYQAAVGSARVGFLSCPSLVQQPNLGILAEANSAYGVSELAAYDPVVPKSWFEAWGAASGRPGITGINNFCASIETAGQAREFGVTYILVPPGSRPPAGTVFAAKIQGVGLWKVPGSGLVTEGSMSAPVTASETVVGYTSPSPGHLRMDLPAGGQQSVRFHISNLPGWHATVDGRYVPIRVWAKAMMSIEVGPGAHRITLDYNPGGWKAGLWTALVTALVLGAWVASWNRLRGWVPVRRLAK